MTRLIDWQKTEDRRDVIHRAVQGLVEGGIVAFPTETVYGLAAYPLHEDAVGKLRDLKQREQGKPFALSFGSVEQLAQAFPSLGPVARRLVTRCLPGPITLVLPSPQEGAVADLPQTVKDLVVGELGVGVRVPDHETILETIKLLPCPLLLTSANHKGEPTCTSGQQVVDVLGEKVEMVIDDGTPRLGQPSTVIHIDESENLHILREGAVPEQRIRRLASEVILFVCTGNSCRSPMAEVLFKKLLADELGVKPEELADNGYLVLSAGIAAYPGGPATGGAVEAVKKYDTSLNDHTSQSLTEELIVHSDRIIVMTRDHRDALRTMVPHLWEKAESKTTLLGGDADIEDPIGGSNDRYAACAEQIMGYLKPLLAQVQSSKQSDNGA